MDLREQIIAIIEANMFFRNRANVERAADMLLAEPEIAEDLRKAHASGELDRYYADALRLKPVKPLDLETKE